MCIFLYISQCIIKMPNNLLNNLVNYSLSMKDQLYKWQRQRSFGIET